MTPPPRNPYCAALGIDPPDLAALAADPRKKLRFLMIAALLERGTPMTMEEIVERLEALGVGSAIQDLAHSLRKSWHGMAPVYKDDAGRFALDTQSREWFMLLSQLRPPEPRRAPAAGPARPSDDVPLSARELELGLKDRWMHGIPAGRQAAAVLDAMKRPMTIAEVEAFLGPLTTHRDRLASDFLSRPAHDSIVRRDAAGILSLVPDEARVRGMRAKMREFLEIGLRDAERRESQPARTEAFEHWQGRERAEAAARRRAVLHGFFRGDRLAAVTILDVAAHSLRTMIGDEVTDAPAALASFDLLVGLDPRRTAAALGIDVARVRLVDLNRRPKSKRINKRGGILKITLPLLFSGSVGLSRPLGDPKKMAEYLEAGERTRFVRRMESDAKALHALYAYGVLQRGLRLRWGFLNEMVGVDWAEPGDPSIGGLLHTLRPGQTLEIVAGSAPGWEEPWARARRMIGMSGNWGPLQLEDPDGDRWVAMADVQAARVVQ